MLSGVRTSDGVVDTQSAKPFQIENPPSLIQQESFRHSSTNSETLKLQIQMARMEVNQCLQIAPAIHATAL